MNIIEKLTHKMKELLEKAHSLAFYNKNPELHPLHFLYSLIINQDSILRQVLNQLNVESTEVEGSIKDEIQKLTKVSSLTKEGISLSRELMNSLNLAESLSVKNGDSFISVDT